MQTKKPAINLAIGIAALGLAFAMEGGLRKYSRRQASVAGSPGEGGVKSEAEKEDEGHLRDEDPPDEGDAQPKAQTSFSQKNSFLKYIIVVFVLSIPFWLFGGGSLPLPVDLPMSSFMWINPVIAASILTYQHSGFQGILELWRKTLDFKKIKNKVWLLPGLFLLPAIYFTSFVVMRIAGLSLPENLRVPWLLAPVFYLMFLFPVTGEELGWTGFAIDPLQNRWGALKASLLLGIIWGIWHLIGDVQNQRNASWILWHRFSAVALRILIVWIYNNTGKSVFAAIMHHGTHHRQR